LNLDLVQRTFLGGSLSLKNGSIELSADVFFQEILDDPWDWYIYLHVYPPNTSNSCKYSIHGWYGKWILPRKKKNAPSKLMVGKLKEDPFLFEIIPL